MKIFLDLDGTILDVSLRYYRIYSDALKALGGESVGMEAYWEMKKERVPEDRIAGLEGAAFEKYSAERTAKMESAEYLALDTLLDGACDTIRGLSESHELFIVTMRKKRGLLIDQLVGLGVYGSFTGVFNAGENSDPLGAKASAMRSFNAVPGRDIMVGDTEIDIRAGKASGLQSCAVLTGIRSERLLRLENPDFVIDSINQLSRSVIDECAFPRP
ncbi:MAG: HAD family hydrolase [Deltaproteobacteria bacterium]|nr:HAD family hydrolase [Deltaproteobacteria bacterium]